MTRRYAFTLIELLIVVAIIAILAAIAVPNFLEAQTRSKVSRTRADMRSVAVGIESYHVDNNKYPWVNPSPGYHLPGGGFYGGVFRAGITTPIAYLSSLLKDPFGGKAFPLTDPYAGFGTTMEYWYWTEAYFEFASWGGPGSWNATGPGNDVRGCKWSLMSMGPDLHWTHNSHSAGAAAEVNYASRWQYDSTNGTISWGNIVRFGP